ncbi:MAG: FtsX-like permease family protein [Saprospiraceae bacterium]|nr:FtsX-like permease family protein [Saprospiraceae bacterium]
MLKNYLKVAFKVLGRNKFYTFISLFGISFTLMVLMLTIAFIQNELGANKPLSQKEKILLVPGLRMEGYAREEIVEIDSTMVDGAWKYDTTKTENILEDQINSTSNSWVGNKFYENHIKDIKTAALTSVFSPMQSIDVFPNDRKLTLTTNATDANYWRIFDFEFVEGQPFSDAAIENQAFQAIMSKSAAQQYFGKKASYLGEVVTWGKLQFEITGIVKDINTSIPHLKHDIFIPYTHLPPSLLDYGWGQFGNMQLALLGSSSKQLETIRSDFRFIEENFEVQEEGYDKLTIKERTIEELYANNVLQNQERGSDKTLRWIVLVALLLFILIPTINLINLNSTRIMERSAEIGVRKAFGAHTGNLMSQFLLENVVLTGLGGLIGLGLTFFAMNWLNNSVWMENTQLAFNPNIFIYSLIVVLLFGICSGLIPAWRMSKMDVAKAIKRNQL